MKNTENKLLHSKQDILNETKLATDSIITYENNIFKVRETPKVKYFDVKGKLGKSHPHRRNELI